MPDIMATATIHGIRTPGIQPWHNIRRLIAPRETSLEMELLILTRSGAPNEISLKAIRIHIRFYDQGSDQMRDMTFTFPLNVNNTKTKQNGC